MEDVAKLILKVESNRVKTAKNDLKAFYLEAFKAQDATDKLSQKTQSAENNFGGLSGKIGPIVSVLSSLAVAAGAVNKVFRETAALQDYEAQLKTATGSTENAVAAFQQLEEFASTTPYQLNQSIEAFVKLKNLGLDPSERSLRSYGNTASAMGKDLSQFIEAVADATTSEFERLKEFGIKAKQQGDRVSFTFRGMTQTIGNNAEEIENFLVRLGENEFDGAMTERMDTLNGAASNLSDSWDKLFRSIGDGAIGDLMKDSMISSANAIGAVSEKIVQLNNLFESSITKLAALLELSGKEREEFVKGEAARRAGLNTLSKEEEQRKKILELEAKQNAGKEAIANAEKMIRRESLEGLKKYKVLIEEIEVVDKRITEGRSKNLSADIALYTKLRQEMVKFNYEEDKRLTKLEDDSSQEKLKARAALEELVAKKRIEKKIEEREYTSAILDLEEKLYTLREKIKKGEFTDQDIQKYSALEQQIERVHDAEYRYNEENRRLREERIEQDRKEVERQKQIAEKKLQAHRKQFEILKKSLRTEEEEIEESYLTRKEIILRNTEEGEAERTDLLERLEEERTERLKQVTERRNRSIDQKNDELSKLSDSVFDDMGESIIQFTRDGEFSVQRMTDSILNQLQRLAVESAIIAPLKNAFSTQTPSINGGSSSEGFLGSIFQAGFSAFASHHNGGIVGAATQSRNVSPAVFSGAVKYHSGGVAGLRPDEVPAVLQRGEEVITKDDPRHRYNGDSGSPKTIVNIINETGGQVETQQRQNGNENIVDVIIKQAEAFIGNNLNNGRGLAPILQRKYSLSPTLGT